jgi:hypothetical protein
MTEGIKKQAREKLWPQLRKLLVFQLKLYIDAFRDIFLSALSIGAFIIDLVLQNMGADSLFERVLHFGRRTEKAINLFNQHDPEQQGKGSVDSILKGMEGKWKKTRK